MTQRDHMIAAARHAVANGQGTEADRHLVASDDLVRSGGTCVPFASAAAAETPRLRVSASIPASRVWTLPRVDVGGTAQENLHVHVDADRLTLRALLDGETVAETSVDLVALFDALLSGDLAVAFDDYVYDRRRTDG